ELTDIGADVDYRHRRQHAQDRPMFYRGADPLAQASSKRPVCKEPDGFDEAAQVSCQQKGNSIVLGSAPPRDAHRPRSRDPLRADTYTMFRGE
ncbi:hypothetical protein ABTB91_19685, partial [Acinetobacter baumannii]